jgi:hypothetical protein
MDQKEEVKDAGAFYIDDDDRTRLYQFGQLFVHGNPVHSEHDVVWRIYNTFIHDKKALKVTNQNFSKGWNLKTELFPLGKVYSSKVRKATGISYDIKASLMYPLKWILQCNDSSKSTTPQSQLLEMKYFEEEYTASTSTNAQVCDTEGHEMFSHQKFVEYCLRPYSPIQSMIINARTGSGKTRMMQAVLDNFACFPNRKIILFPTAPLRQHFYNKTVRKFSKYYELDNDINRSIVTMPNGEKFEELDRFNKQYFQSDTGISVTGHYDHPIFDLFYRMQQTGKPLGTTLILTYKEFVELSGPARVYGRKHFYTEDGTFTLNGAMVLVDEAHLLFGSDRQSPYQKTISDKVKTLLEKESDHLHTLGLFSATPFDKLDDITKYRKLLGTHLTDPTAIARNYMMYYNETKQDMFNQDYPYTYIEVKDSEDLKERSTALGLEQEEIISRNCWLTHFDKTQHAAWDKAMLVDKIYTPRKEELKNKSILEQYDFLMSDLRSDALSLLKDTYPKMGYALEQILRQLRHRDARTMFWKNLATLPPQSLESYMGFLDRLEHRDTTLDLSSDRAKVREYCPMMATTRSAEARGDTSPTETWYEIVQTQRKRASEDRIVVMIDFRYGLVELSKLLALRGKAHVILQIETTSRRVTGNLAQIHGVSHSLPETTKSATGRYKDDVLVDFINEHTEDVPVVIYNSQNPEGINLQHATHMHVLPTSDSYTALTQMVGRINRMCHTTYNEKTVYMYVYPNSGDEKRIQDEHDKQTKWPRLNTLT